ncbi:hypothetical protein Tco_1356293, partial [Tanacetum coccineum]
MVTSEGIRANSSKTKAIADMQSPRTLKEMQSLSEKLAALKRRGKGVPRDEEIHSEATIANDPHKGRNTLRIPGSGNRGCECRVAYGKEGKKVSDTL